MFHPMAFTVVAALLGALIFSVTFVPASIAIFVRGKVHEEENRVMKKARELYTPLLNLSLNKPIILVSIATVLVIASGLQASRLGTEFLPQLDEYDMALHALRIPGTSLEQSVAMQQQLEQVISEFGEVQHVFAKIGTPEVATDPMPPNVADTFLICPALSFSFSSWKVCRALANDISTSRDARHAHNSQRPFCMLAVRLHCAAKTS